METINHTKIFQELIKGIDSDFDNTEASKIKMLRHADRRTKLTKKNNHQKLLINGKPFPANITSLYALYVYRPDLFMDYQSGQKKCNFKNIKYIISFIGENKLESRFVGIYKILGVKQDPNALYDDDIILELEHVKAFEHLEREIVIDWGSPANAWHQYFYNKKQVIKIDNDMPDTDATPLFKSYLDIILNHAQLELVINNPDWVAALKKVNCIYAILDSSNGKLYVGSTYNQSGILGRWEQYAKTGHGYNIDLEKIGSEYCKNNLKWCILEVLPLDVTDFEAIAREKLWKQKLGTGIFGYTNN